MARNRYRDPVGGLKDGEWKVYDFEIERAKEQRK